MATNRLKLKRIQKGLSQGALAKLLPNGMTAMGLSFIETGKAMPTKEGLRAICSTLECTPFDLFDEDDLNLASSSTASRSDFASMNTRKNGFVEFRTLITQEEKAQLEEAMKVLGYRGPSEWFREAFRSLVTKARFRSDQ